MNVFGMQINHTVEDVVAKGYMTKYAYMAG